MATSTALQISQLFVAKSWRWRALFLVMLLTLHFAAMWGVEDAWARGLMLVHFGVFILWQPFMRGERRLTPSQVAASFAAGPSGGGSGGNNPSLSASVSGNNLVITWPASATGFNLEGSPALGAGATWTTISGTTIVGGNVQATVPMTGKAQFFRLHKP